VEVCPDEHNEDVRPEITWDLSSFTRVNSEPYISTSSFATMSINAVNTNCINVSTVSGGGPFTTNAQSQITASLTGSNWPTSSRAFLPYGYPYSITMSLTTAGITYDPLAVNQFYSASVQYSSSQIAANPNITGSILTNKFLASEFYRFYVSGSITINEESSLALNTDPYSASLVLAIPGMYAPGYGMQSFRSDISSYIRGNGKSFSDIELPLTSSDVPSFGTGSFAATFTPVKWNYYSSSIQISGSNGSGSLALRGNPTASQFEFTTQSFTIETYINYQNSATGGYTTDPAGGNYGPTNINATMYWQYETGVGFNTNGIAYQNPGVRFLIISSTGAEIYFDSPQKNRVANEWYHFGCQRSASLFSAFWSGSVVQSFTFAGTLRTGSLDAPFFIMGGQTLACKCHRYQDYRIYNGIAKYDNATSGSTYTQPIAIFAQP
jgi:hypothetical protein